MRPVLFTVLGLTFYAYRTALALAFITCALLVARAFRRAIPGTTVSPLIGLWAMIAALVGARLFYTLQYNAPSQWWRALLVWEGGLVFYGGLASGLLAVAIYLRIHRVPFLQGVDIIAPYVALGEAITRVGCFFNGCCYGAPSALPWAAHFPAQSLPFEQQVRAGLIDAGADHSLGTHPTQLYMTVALLLAFYALHTFYFKPHRNGDVFVAYLFLYGLIRFVVEMLRADSVRSLYGMTLYQAISLGLVCAALVYFVTTRLRRAAGPPANGITTPTLLE